jgi:acylphosphatase
MRTLPLHCGRSLTLSLSLQSNFMIARQILFTGRVQGVGFRWTTKSIAGGFEVTGWVKNLPDGRVEMQVQAIDSDELHAFLEAIDESDLGSCIKEREVHIIEPLMGIRGFTIER